MLGPIIAMVVVLALFVWCFFLLFEALQYFRQRDLDGGLSTLVVRRRRSDTGRGPS